MEKQKRWHLALIVGVLALTLYNILPTILFYTKPLDRPIQKEEGKKISLAIAQRVNDLESFSIEWLQSFCKLLHIEPQTISFDPHHAQHISLSFTTESDAQLFRHHLPRAGSFIPFTPAQLSLNDLSENASLGRNVFVKRRIPLHIDGNDIDAFYQFSHKTNEQGEPTDLYQTIVRDRALQIGLSLGGISEMAQIAQAIVQHVQSAQIQELATGFAQNLIAFANVFGEDSVIAKRYYASVTQANIVDKPQFVHRLAGAIDFLKDQAKLERIALQKEQEKSSDALLNANKRERLSVIKAREQLFSSAETLIRKHASSFCASNSPFTFSTLERTLKKSHDQPIVLGDSNPFIERLTIDWQNEQIILQLHRDIAALRQEYDSEKLSQSKKDQIDQLIYNQIAWVSRQSSEKMLPQQDKFLVDLSNLPDSKSFLTMRLSEIANQQLLQIRQTIIDNWHPEHPDLQANAFPIWSYETYATLPAEQKKLGLLVYSPSLVDQTPPQGMRMNSIYVIAKGIDRVLESQQESTKSPEFEQFMADFHQLRQILQKQGFYGYSGGSFHLSSEFTSDFIFEQEDYFQDVLKATREDFTVRGTKRFAVLEFSNVEQRILATNKIETRIHEDLLKWRDDYHAASLGIKGLSPLDIPAPTQNAYWNNFKLSLRKLFRGDERKVLHWGLDMSGGKTVQLELRDNNNQVVHHEDDIKQGINELYQRVNKMGVSEVSIRQEGHTISLDFPGSQSLSAAELVKASSMFFHVVNEKFSSSNPALSQHIQQFLQEVWNEAAVTNRKEIEEINQIAWKHLHGDSLDPDTIQPRSESAKILYENDLRLASTTDTTSSSAYQDVLSKITAFRGDDFTEWHGQTHPLLVVFRNYALEGSNLENVMASYDPSKGNFLSFGIKGTVTSPEGLRFNARDDLETWTTNFSREKIIGTPREAFSGGRGWRMAAILNGSVISAPTLDSPLRDRAMITGSFTQREVNQLEADLKAGSLSFTPKILSEKNVSPELGSQERHLGILGMSIALLLVFVVMIAYYRFGGLVASVAVLLNLFIMWATLQNLQATMTLAGIAGIILTVGMAVDANVLVFERIREEFAISGRIASAVQAGYRKAFSAIIDSNITTLIAALILLNFDSGPIKGFAVTLIIGLVSSMFTALFMTRYFFARWVQNPSHKELRMLNLFKTRNFDFLKYTKATLVVTSILILVGAYLAFSQRNTILGMDFTGGYALTVNLESNPQDIIYRQKTEQALEAQGASSQDIAVRELNSPHHLRIFLSKSMEEPGHPFYQMPLENSDLDSAYFFENNPRIVWIVDALTKAGLKISSDSLQALDQNWTSLSGQMSDTMRTNAFIGLCIALVSILVYITIRFEFTYAAAATICLLHDVIFTIAIMAILHKCGVPVQIDLHTVAALMTIVGYSLNDTIIVFDRIREDLRFMKKASLSDVINHALNITLSRTVMTSGTTLLVLLPLIALGGSTVFAFSLVMAIGVIFGTLSSLFIAAPLMQYFHNQELRKPDKLLVNEH